MVRTEKKSAGTVCLERGNTREIGVFLLVKENKKD